VRSNCAYAHERPADFLLRSNWNKQRFGSQDHHSGLRVEAGAAALPAASASRNSIFSGCWQPRLLVEHQPRGLDMDGILLSPPSAGALPPWGPGVAVPENRSGLHPVARATPLTGSQSNSLP